MEDETGGGRKRGGGGGCCRTREKGTSSSAAAFGLVGIGATDGEHSEETGNRLDRGRALRTGRGSGGGGSSAEINNVELFKMTTTSA